MTWLLLFLGLFVGAFLGCLGMAFACARKDADDGWDRYEQGHRDGVDHMAEMLAADGFLDVHLN